jgi:tetratricopeptide (TPR) repeat protein
MELYQKSGKYDSALQVVNDILELTPDDLDARERKGQLFLLQNKWEEASEEYKYILKQKDVPFEIKLRIGIAYFNKSITDSTITPIAKEFFQEIDKDTTDWQVKMYLGAIALNEKDDTTAIENFKLVTELAKWNVDGWVHLGGLYFDNRKYNEAITVLNEAISSFPDNFAVNLILGLSYAQQDKHLQAKEYLKKSVNLNPKDINALSAYAYTLNQLKDNDEAVEYLKKALELKPNDINLLGTLGLIYDSQEKWAECDSIYEKALTIDSSNSLVNNNYAYSLSERGIKLQKALKMAKLAVEKDPLNSSYLDTIGWVYFKLGDYEKAKDYLEQAIKAGGERAVMLEHLGDVIYMSGQKDHARELWQKALNLDENNNKLKLKIEKGEI